MNLRQKIQQKIAPLHSSIYRDLLLDFFVFSINFPHCYTHSLPTLLSPTQKCCAHCTYVASPSQLFQADLFRQFLVISLLRYLEHLSKSHLSISSNRSGVLRSVFLEIPSHSSALSKASTMFLYPPCKKLGRKVFDSETLFH